MAWIETVPPDQATGQLKRIYQASEKQFGFVPNIRRALSLDPEMLRGYLQLSGAVYGGGPLPALEREMIAVLVSATNGCHY